MESYLALHSSLISRVEKFARRLLEAQFDPAQSLWHLEFDLVKYQVEMQKAISSEKAIRQEIEDKRTTITSTKSGNWIVELQQLQEEKKQCDDHINIYRYAYLLSRRFGAAFAWVLLGNALLPLTQISSEPTRDGHQLPDAHGLQGILAAAESLCAAGAGFPILHDVTNCLRVGDITFYSPGNDPVTIEVKTHYKGSNDGILSLEVEIYIIHDLNDNKRWDDIIANFSKKISMPSALAPDEEGIPHIPRQLETRLNT